MNKQTKKWTNCCRHQEERLLYWNPDDCRSRWRWNYVWSTWRPKRSLFIYLRSGLS